MHTINLPYKQGYVTPVPAAVVVNTYEFREAEDPSVTKFCIPILKGQTFIINKSRIRPLLKLEPRISTRAGLLSETAKKVPDELLVCGVGDL